MFLNRLNDKKKRLFLDLCIHATWADGITSDAEKITIDAYCREMEIGQNNYEASQDLQEVISRLRAECSASEIMIIMIEIMALMMADKNYDSPEKEFMKNLQNNFSLSDDTLEEIRRKTENLLSAFLILNELTNKYQ